jgi:peptidoglycan hydrolase-like protein with peptidoglycan-binding domain
MIIRSLPVAAALAATLGIAGLAQAQTNPAPVSQSAPGIAPATPGASSGQMTPATPETGSNQTTPAMPEASSGQMAKGTPTSVSPTTVRQAQRRLRSQGLYQGPIDGEMGPATRTALSHYQRKEGLPQTAMLDSQTVKDLLPGSFSGSNSGTATAPGR